MNVQKPQRPQPQYAPTMSGPASSAFTPLSGGMNGNVAFQGLPQNVSQPGYQEISLASQLGLFFPAQGLSQQVWQSRHACPVAAHLGPVLQNTLCDDE